MISSIDSILSYYREHSDFHSASRETRSELIHRVGALYESSTKTESTLNKKYYQRGLSDGFLQTAEDVFKGNHLNDFPGAQMRLMPLAESYIGEWGQLLDVVGKVSARILDENILTARADSFVQAHRAFSKHYIQERTVHRVDTEIGVELTQPVTLEHFYSSALEFLDERPDLSSLFKQMLEESDSKVFLLLPSLALLRCFKQKDGPCPELLKDFELAPLRDTYERLSSDEIEAIQTHLFNDSAELSENARELYLQILGISYRLQESALASPFANCCRTLITELNCDVGIAERIKADLAELNLQGKEMDLPELTYALLHFKPEFLKLLYPILTCLPEIECFRAEFCDSNDFFKNEVRDYLRTAKPIDSNPEFMNINRVVADIKHEPKLYRLYGIFQLALKK